LHKDGSSTTTFTIGGVIVMGGSLYGLTAGHVFARRAHDSGFESESPETGSSSGSGSGGGFEGSTDADEEDDDDDDDDDSPFVFFTAAALEGRSEPQLSNDHGRAQPSIAASRSPDRPRVPSRALGAATVGRPSAIGSLYHSGGVSGRHLDWALVKLQDPYP